MMSQTKNTVVDCEYTVFDSKPADSALDSRGHRVFITTGRLLAAGHLILTPALKTQDPRVYYQDSVAKITV